MNPTDLRVVSGTLKGRKIESPPSKLTHPMGSREKLALFNMITGKTEGAKVLDAYAGSGALGIECLSRGAKEVTFVEAYRPTALVLVRNLRSLGIKGEIFTGTVAKFVENYLSRTVMVPVRVPVNSAAGADNASDMNQVTSDQRSATEAANKNIKIQNFTNAISQNVMNALTFGAQGTSVTQTGEIEIQKNPSQMWTPNEEVSQVSVAQKAEQFDLIFADPPYSYFDLQEVTMLVQLLKNDGTFVLSYPSDMRVPTIQGLKMTSNHVYSRAGIAIYQKV